MVQERRHLQSRRRDLHGRRTATAIGDFPGLTAALDYLRPGGRPASGCSPSTPRPTATTATTSPTTTPSIPASARLGDFVEFMHRAHGSAASASSSTSSSTTPRDQHPWFQAARRDRSSPYRDYYVWSDERARRTTTRAWSSPASRRHLDLRRRGRRLLLPPFLRAPARPQHRQPGRARGDPEDHGLLAGARASPASASTPRPS